MPKAVLALPLSQPWLRWS